MRRADRTIKTAESWASASILLWQFWTKGVPTLIATGVGAWLASHVAALSNQGWAAWVIVGAIFAFALIGAVSFASRTFFNWRAMRAVNQAVRWNEAIFSPGEVIDGGTHTVSEIFGNDAVRSGVLFRNCQIIGPGVISLFSSPTYRCEISAVPFPVVLPSSDDFAMVGNHVHQFHRCHFDNVTFYNVMVFQQPQNQWRPTHIFAKIPDPLPEQAGPEAKKAEQPVPEPSEIAK